MSGPERHTYTDSKGGKHGYYIEHDWRTWYAWPEYEDSDYSCLGASRDEAERQLFEYIERWDVK